MIRRPPRSTLSSSSAASDVYKRQRGWRRLRLVHNLCDHRLNNRRICKMAALDLTRDSTCVWRDWIVRGSTKSVQLDCPGDARAACQSTNCLTFYYVQTSAPNT